MTRRTKAPASEACAGCCRPISKHLPNKLCPICWNVEAACRDEGVANLAELADPHRARTTLLWRVSDIVRRSNVEDAEALIRRLERHIS